MRTWFTILLPFFLAFFATGSFAQSNLQEDQVSDAQPVDSSEVAGMLRHAIQLSRTDRQAAISLIEKGIELATANRDSNLLRDFRFTAFELYRQMGEWDTAVEQYRRCVEVSIPYGIRLDIPFFDSLPFYNWHLNSWQSCLEILEDPEGTLEFDQVLSEQYQDQFRYNTVEDVDSNTVYWVRARVRGGHHGKRELFSVGGGMYSWGIIDVYYTHSGQWKHARTGTNLPAADKSIRDAFNYFIVETDSTDQDLYLRLALPNPEFYPGGIHLNHLDFHSDIELEGYRFPGFYIETEPDGYSFITIQRSLEILPDPDGIHDIETVSSDWDALGPRMKDFLPIDRTIDHWVRMRVIGTLEGSGTQLFLIGDEGFSWPKIEIYQPLRDGSFEKSTSGFTTLKKHKPLSHGMNLFEIPVRFGDTTEVFLLLKGGRNRYIPDGISFYHLNATEFWSASNRKSFIFGLVQGAIWVQAIFFLLLGIIEREKSHVYYAAFLLSTSLFTLTEDAFMWHTVFTRLSDIQPYLYLLTHFLIAASLLKFTEHYMDLAKSVFPWRKIINAAILVVIALVIIDFVVFINDTSYDVYGTDNWVSDSKLIAYMAIFVLIAVISVIRIRQKFRPATFFLLAISGFIISGSLLLAVGLYDMDQLDFIDPLLAQTGLLLTVILFSLGSGYRTRRLKKDREAALEETILMQEQANITLQEKNALKDQFIEASGKFVPHAFIKALGRGDITEVALGDSVSRDVTVLFGDVRDYTTIAEGLSPEETYTFVREVHELTGPVIREHNGFINDYAGDGVMAIFPDGPKDGLEAAIAIQKALQAFNKARSAEHNSRIRLGIGLHCGSLIMGIIGDQERMAATTISDVVNTASRIEGLTKHYGVKILLTKECTDQIENLNEFHTRYLGKVQVKGRSQPLDIYECFDGDNPSVLERKKSTCVFFEEGMNHYQAGDLEMARKALKAVDDKFPGDKSTLLFLEKLDRLQADGFPENWSPVERMKSK